MDQKFHYDAIYILAIKAGFDSTDSFTVAYASQYVDDNTREITANGNSSLDFTCEISQTMNIFKPQEEKLRIYPCFHFIPGDPTDECTRRLDGRTHVLNTTPNSRNANIVIDEALLSGNLYRIGIAAHAFADTWAHQNFTGTLDDFNEMGSLIPNIGHADARKEPDKPGNFWRDPRLIIENQAINNNLRFLEAAEHIFCKFRRYRKPNATKPEIIGEWQSLYGKLKPVFDQTAEADKKSPGKDGTSPIEAFRQNLPGSRDYEEYLWRDAALQIEKRELQEKIDERKIIKRKFSKKNGFEDSDWYQFQVAVIEHQIFVTNLLKDTFRQVDSGKF